MMKISEATVSAPPSPPQTTQNLVFDMSSFVARRLIPVSIDAILSDMLSSCDINRLSQPSGARCCRVWDLAGPFPSGRSDMLFHPDPIPKFGGAKTGKVVDRAYHPNPFRFVIKPDFLRQFYRQSVVLNEKTGS